MYGSPKVGDPQFARLMPAPETDFGCKPTVFGQVKAALGNLSSADDELYALGRDMGAYAEAGPMPPAKTPLDTSPKLEDLLHRLVAKTAEIHKSICDLSRFVGSRE